MNKLSQSALARALGLAKSRVTALKIQGMPVHSVEAAQAWRKADPEKVTNFAESGLFLENPQITLNGNKLIYSKRRTAGDIWLLSLNR